MGRVKIIGTKESAEELLKAGRQVGSPFGAGPAVEGVGEEPHDKLKLETTGCTPLASSFVLARPVDMAV